MASQSGSAPNGQVTIWDFTTFLPKGSVDDIGKDKIEKKAQAVREVLSAIASKYVFQVECGTESNRLHFQGRLHLIKRARLTGIIKLVKETVMEGSHFSVTSSACRQNNFYVTKEETRVDGFVPWRDEKATMAIAEKDFVPRQIKDIHIKDWYPWQKTVYRKSKEFDPRKIQVIVDIVGNVGKSFLITWMMANKFGVEIPPVNEFKDVAQFLCSLIEKNGRESAKNIFIDFPRALKKDKIYPFMAGLERMKDGRVFDTRYKARSVLFDSPNIFCYMNVFPSLSYMSRDRWDFFTIDENMELVPVPLWPKDGEEELRVRVEKIQERLVRKRESEQEAKGNKSLDFLHERQKRGEECPKMDVIVEANTANLATENAEDPFVLEDEDDWSSTGSELDSSEEDCEDFCSSEAERYYMEKANEYFGTENLSEFDCIEDEIKHYEGLAKEATQQEEIDECARILCELRKWEKSDMF